MDGRVLSEAMTGNQALPPEPQEQKLEAQRDLGFRTWHQYLNVVRVGYATYYDEGNGESQLK